MSRRTADYLAGNSCNNSSLGAAKGSSRPLQHRGNHVASLLAYRQPETLAEQLLAQQEHNNDLQEQLKHALTDARHKEVELRHCRQALLAAEGLLQARQQPCVTITHSIDDPDGYSSTAPSGSSSQRTHRERQLSPRRAAAAALSCTQQACLIGALKDQNAALKATVSQLEQQYSELAQPDGAASQVGSLQQQLVLVLGQLQQQQQQQLVQQLACRAEDAQQTAQAAAAQVDLASRALREVQALAAAAVQGDMSGSQVGQDLLDLVAAFVGPRPAGPDASAPCTYRALAAAQDAHRMLLQQALLLRGRLPSAPGFAGISAAQGWPRSAGRCSSPSRPDRPDSAVELLMFLRSHVARLQATLDSLPGAAAASMQQLVQATDNSIGSCHAGAYTCPTSAGVLCTSGEGQAAEQHWHNSSSSRPPALRVRPCSAQVAGSGSAGSFLGIPLAAGQLVRPASAAPASVARRPHSAQKSQQQRQPDLSPYLNYPGKRLGSGKSSEVAALQGTVQQLQVLLQEKQEQMQVQAEEAMQLQQFAQQVHQQLEAAQQQLAKSQQAVAAEQHQLQQAVQQLQQQVAQLEQQLAVKQQELTEVSAARAGEQQQLQALQQHSAELHQQLAVAQASTVVPGQQQLQAEVGRLQQQNVSLQQQLEAAQQERDSSQQAVFTGEQLAQSMLKHAQQLQREIAGRWAIEQQTQQQLQAVEQALLQCEQQLGEQCAAQQGAGAGFAPANTAELARSVAAYAATLSAMAADSGQAGELQELGAAVATLLAAMRQMLALSASVEGSESATTEQLEAQLVENTEAVEECMAALQEVCAVSRRASAAGPALLVHFNPYTRTSLSGMVPLAAAPPAADGAAADDGHASAGAWGGVADTADDGAACSREAGAVASEASALQSDSAADESGTLAVERAGDTGGDWSVMESDDLRIAAAE